MIERVFDSALLDPDDRHSVVEEGLRGWLETHRPRLVTTVEQVAGPIIEVATDGERHGGGRLRRELTDTADAGADQPDDGGRERRLGEFRRLLEAGARHLDAGRAARREQGRQVALEMRALAAFARSRPAGALDRADDEVGAAAAASRAARPEVLTEVSEWAVDEVMAEYGLSKQAAQTRLVQAITLDEQLPATLDALEAAVIGWPHAAMLVDELGVLTDPGKRALVEAELLAKAAGKTVAALREAARRAVLRVDAEAAARRLARAIRRRHVRVSPGRDGEGSLSVGGLPLPVVLACHKALEAYAEACTTPDDPRTKDQRMADCLVDLILRPDADHPPVQLALTVVAGVGTLSGGNEPGEVDGHPVPAALVRELLHALGLAPRTDPPQPVDDDETADENTETVADADESAPTDRTAPGGTIDTDDADPADDTDTPDDADDTDETDPASAADTAADHDAAAADHDAAAADDEGDGAEDDDEVDADNAGATTGGADGNDTVADNGDPQLGEEATPAEPSDQRPAPGWLAELLDLRKVTGTALTHLPTIAVVDEISGQLLALTTTAQLRSGQALGPPGPTSGYTPSVPLQKFVRARDRRCRFPGCRAAAIRCDLDHNQPWPLGATSADNLCCLCRHHHRLSHQAPGWAMRRLPDGGLQWTTPSGTVLTTYPPPYGTDDIPPPPAPEPPPPPRTLRERILGRPPTPEERLNDPPPF
jgi:hypothetical protein